MRIQNDDVDICAILYAVNCCGSGVTTSGTHNGDLLIALRKYVIKQLTEQLQCNVFKRQGWSVKQFHQMMAILKRNNGHDIWVWDDAGGYPPRSVFGFFSKDTLQYRVGFQRREKLNLLTDVRPRLIEIVARIETALYR